MYTGTTDGKSTRTTRVFTKSTPTVLALTGATGTQTFAVTGGLVRATGAPAGALTFQWPSYADIKAAFTPALAAGDTFDVYFLCATTGAYADGHAWSSVDCNLSVVGTTTAPTLWLRWVLTPPVHRFCDFEFSSHVEKSCCTHTHTQ